MVNIMKKTNITNINDEQPRFPDICYVTRANTRIRGMVEVGESTFTVKNGSVIARNLSQKALDDPKAGLKHIRVLREALLESKLLVEMKVEDILLLKGAPDKRIWANLYNGLGGHLESDEDVISAAKREVLEESGIQIDDLHLRAVVNINAGKPMLGILMFVFTAWTDQREFERSHEGDLEWIPIAELDRYSLVEDLQWLLPRILGDAWGSAPRYLYYYYDSDDRLVIQEAE